MQSVGACVCGVFLCKKIKINVMFCLQVLKQVNVSNSYVVFYGAKGKLRNMQCDGWTRAMVLKSAELGLKLCMSFAILVLAYKAHNAS